MRANRQIFHQPLTLKMKNIWICKKIGVKTPRQLITDAGLKFIHSVINKQKPPELYKLIKFPKKFRRAAQISTYHQPRTKKCRRSYFYKAIRQFDALHNSLKFLPQKTFKKALLK